MKKDFSVLMSVYYKENPLYLDDALNSVFNQSLVPSEVVLVEDGKLTIELDDIILKYVNKYPKIMKVIKYDENRGLGKALHDGVLECSNEIVFRMDSDDISDRNRFKITMDVFNSMNVDVVGGNILEYDDKMDCITGNRIVPSDNEQIVKMMKKRNAINHVTVAYKKDKVIEAGNYLDMPYFEDYYLWVRMILNNSIFYNIQSNLVNVRCGNEMIKRRGGFNYIKHIINFENKIYKLKFIGFSTYIINVCERVFVSIVPNCLRKFVYDKFLRRKVS